MLKKAKKFNQTFYSNKTLNIEELFKQKNNISLVCSINYHAPLALFTLEILRKPSNLYSIKYN